MSAIEAPNVCECKINSDPVAAWTRRWYPGHPVYVWCVSDWSMLDGSQGGFPSGLEGMYSKLKVPFLMYMP